MGSLSDFFDKHDPDGRWRAGALTGLASGTFSTVLISLGGPRIGRDVPLDWMEIASINLRDRTIVSEPGWPQVLPGILTHQSVDLAWAAAYFGLGIGRLGQEKQRKALLAGAIPWAVASSAFEFFVAIPILQRLLKMQVPYWTGLTVHLASSVAYPLFPWIRRRIAGEETTPDEDRLARLTLLAMGGSIAALALLEVLARKGHEPRWPFDREQEIEVGRSFLRQMTAHHELGVRLSRLLRDKATQKEARVLGTLMYAEHVGELDAMRRWWRNWYGGEMPEPTEEEHERMPGMPPTGRVDELETMSGAAFERSFYPVMISHHEGAITMSDDLIRRARDPRLILFADQIRYAQRNQVQYMRELEGRA